MGLNHLANGAWLAEVIAHNLARWTARIGLGEQLVTTKTLRRRFFSLAGRLTRSASPCTGLARFSRALARFRACSRPRRPSGLNFPDSRECFFVLSRHLAHHSLAGRYQHPQ